MSSILFSVGDHSADTHAANLMSAIRAEAPDVGFTGFGLERMLDAGLRSMEEEEAPEGAMWLHNLLRVGHYKRRLDICRRAMDEGRVDLVLPMDFGGFNICLCRAASQRGVPVFYYIPPQVWGHSRYRLKKLRKWTTLCGLIYPFEPALYARWGVPGQYVGHPLFDEIRRVPPSETKVESLRQRFGDRLIGVFPGSRRQEVVAHMEMIGTVCRRVNQAVPQARFAVTCPPGVSNQVAEGLPGGLDVALLEDVRAIELAAASHLCIAKSGTVTLEIASQRKPMVIFYRAQPFACFMAYGLAHVQYIGIVNNLAGRDICPEKLMTKPDPDWLTQETLHLLQDADAYGRCREDIERVMDGFAEPGASERAARLALRLL